MFLFVLVLNETDWLVRELIINSQLSFTHAFTHIHLYSQSFISSFLSSYLLHSFPLLTLESFNPYSQGSGWSSHLPPSSPTPAVELVDSQVLLKGCESQGYVILSAAKSQIRQQIHRPVWQDHSLVTKTTWIGSLQCMQYYATVSAGDKETQMGECAFGVVEVNGWPRNM